nr:MAG TPA: hypothetical protein [Caudoviricetes sp.]
MFIVSPRMVNKILVKKIPPTPKCESEWRV